MDEHNKKDGTYHYYTYGRVPADREAERSRERQEEADERKEYGSVEMTPPRELRTYPMMQQPTQLTRQQQAAWSYSDGRPPRRSAFKSVVASFLAGALVVGSLMFASDRMNLFSGSNAAATGAAAAGESADMVAGEGLRTASIDVVRPNTIAALVDIASPAVVKIETFAKQGPRRQSLFDEFFQTPETRSPTAEPGNLVQVGSGSGFFFDDEGYILTNEHVINGAEQVKVIVEGVKEPYTAEVLGTAYDLDLAVLKIKGEGAFPALPLGSSEKIEEGDWVVAIGNPYEFDHTVTVGVLSAKERAIDIPDTEGTRRYQALLQTDASINPGNSGGPLLNLDGEVIGINTAVNAQAQGIGFAIPTSTINEVLDSLKANKAIPRPFIGIMMGDVPEEYIDDLKLENGDGAFISEIMLGSPAYEAGLQKYDVVVSINGEKVKTAEELSKIVGRQKPGDKLALHVIRNGKAITVTVTVGDRNGQSQQ
jgi:serine protease Do